LLTTSQDFLAAKIPPVPQRRATSPARSSFTLFPTSQPSKAAEILGTQNYSRGPSPLLRSNTLPAESPSQELPLQPPRAIPNNNSVTSFQSLPIGNVFSQQSHTPRSSSLSSRFDDKPLPAIKPEPEPESSASLQNSTKDSSPKPPNIPQSQSQIPTSKSQQNLKQRSSPLKNERHVQERGQQERSQQEKTHEENVKQELVHREKRRQEQMHHEKKDQSQLHHPKQKPRPSRPNLTIKTTPTPLPRPTLKERPVRSSSIPISEESIPKIVTDEPGMTMSPSPLSSGSMSAVTPRPTQRLPQPARSKSSKAGKKEATTNGETQIIQFSTARSVSVSKGKRQMLVPIGSRVDHFDSNERFVDRKALTPTITEVGYGHRPAKSQQLQIESL